MAGFPPEIPAAHAVTLVDPAAYADGRIYTTYSWLRANCPIGLARPAGFDPFWVISRFDDVKAISLDSKRFPYGERNSLLNDKASDELTRAITGGRPTFARTLINMDAPDHMKYRLITQKQFMPGQLKRLDEQIGKLADEAVAKLAGREHIDFVEDVALYYPLEIIMSLLGVPKHDLPFMLRLTQEIFAPLDPDTTPEGIDPTDPLAMAKAMQKGFIAISQYFDAITADRRVSPRDDIATVLSQAMVDDGPIPELDLIGYYAIITTAGHDTTSTTASAAMLALANQPSLLPRLKADRSLIPKFVEEAIRWASPVKTFMRSPTEDVEHNGIFFKKGDWLMLCYASANRDEAKFDDADHFSIDRPNPEHLSFGYGPHVCLGQHLARRELIALYDRLVSALASVELAGPTEMSKSYFVNGLKRLPIHYTLEKEPMAIHA